MLHIQQSDLEQVRWLKIDGYLGQLPMTFLLPQMIGGERYGYDADIFRETGIRKIGRQFYRDNYSVVANILTLRYCYEGREEERVIQLGLHSRGATGPDRPPQLAYHLPAWRGFRNALLIDQDWRIVPQVAFTPATKIQVFLLDSHFGAGWEVVEPLIALHFQTGRCELPSLAIWWWQQRLKFGWS